MLQKLSGSLLVWSIVIGLLSPIASADLSSAQSLAAKWVIKSGSSAADFRLNDTITRKEMLKIVMNLSGKNVPNTCTGKFGDVVDDWGCKYIEAALSNGFIAKNASFRPDDTITKAESLKLLLGARGIEKAYNTSDWQGDWMNTAFDNGLLTAKFTDHNSTAVRGWIFGVGAKPVTSWAVATSTPAPAPTPAPEESSTPVPEVEEKVVETPTVLAGQFADYSPSLVGKNEATVLFFHASWCPSCRAAEANFQKDDFSKTDLSILKVDFDSSTDLRKKYGVTSQHTFVQVDASGELIAKWGGSNNLSGITSKLK